MSATALYFFFFTPTTPPVTPTLSVSPVTLTFITDVGINPPTQNVTITNSGTGTLTWSRSVAGGVISASPAGGTAPSVMAVSVNVTGLTPGIYGGSITITAPGANGSPIVIPISVVINAAAPTLGVSPTVLQFTAQQGTNPPPLLVQVLNLGDGTLDWLTTVLGPNVAVTPVSGVTPATFQVAVDTTGLAVGTHARQIRVDASVQQLPVVATFEGTATLSMSATASTLVYVSAFAAAVTLRISASSVLGSGPVAFASAVVLRVTTTAVLTPGTDLFAAAVTLRVTTTGNLTTAPISAFEGFGAATTGGAGFPIINVTNLNDTLEGAPTIPNTLRWAMEQTVAAGGNRRIHLNTPGTINLLDASIFVENVSNVTIEATAPVTIERFGFNVFFSNNILLKNLRVRRPVGELDYIGFYASNTCVVDHCSVIGAPFTVPGSGELGDGGVDVKGGSFNITVQWSLLGVAKMALVGSSDSDADKHTRDVTYHHNAFIAVVDTGGVFDPNGGYSDRSPLVRRAQGGLTTLTCDFRHNIVAYAFRANASKIGGNGRANVVANAYIPAPGTSVSDRQQCIKLDASFGDPPLAFTASNVELGTSPPLAFDINTVGTQGSAFTAPALTPTSLLTVFNTVGPQFTRDADEQARLDSIAAFSPFT